MVRTEGRSTACLTCLRRKKGCDRQKPSCGQCRKSCVLCLGYQRSYEFRNVTAEDISESRASLSLKASKENGELQYVYQRELIRSVHIANMLSRFWETYLPGGRQLDPQLGGRATWGIVEPMANAASQTGVLSKATAALCLAVVNLQENDDWIRENSLRFYTEALRDMTVALSRPGRDRGVGLMSAIRIFSIYEAFFIETDRQPPTAQSLGWMTHIVGEISLLLSNGPAFYATGLAHQVFVDDRLFLISLALKNRKTSFLTERTWATLPWSVFAKTPRDHILDILAQVPTAFHEFDEYHKIIDSDPVLAEMKLQSILQYCLRLNDKLAWWRAENSVLVQSWVQVEPLWDMSMGRALLDPSEISMLHLMSLHWATSTLICDTLSKMLGEDELRLCSLSPEASCGKLIVALSNLLHPHIGLFRIHLITVPLSIVMVQLQDPAMKLHTIRNETRLLAHCLAHPGCVNISKFFSKLADSLQFKVRLGYI